jgi:chorismate synthase
VIVEAALAFVLARALLAKFGGDRLDDTLAAIDAYRLRLGSLAPEGFGGPAR